MLRGRQRSVAAKNKQARDRFSGCCDLPRTGRTRACGGTSRLEFFLRARARRKLRNCVTWGRKSAKGRNVTPPENLFCPESVNETSVNCNRPFRPLTFFQTGQDTRANQTRSGHPDEHAKPTRVHATSATRNTHLASRHTNL